VTKRTGHNGRGGFGLAGPVLLVGLVRYGLDLTVLMYQWNAILFAATALGIVIWLALGPPPHEQLAYRARQRSDLTSRFW